MNRKNFNNKSHQGMIGLWRDYDRKYGTNETAIDKSKNRHDKKLKIAKQFQK